MSSQSTTIRRDLQEFAADLHSGFEVILPQAFSWADEEGVAGTLLIAKPLPRLSLAALYRRRDEIAADLRAISNDLDSTQLQDAEHLVQAELDAIESELEFRAAGHG
jgi:hypothetical protein